MNSKSSGTVDFMRMYVMYLVTVCNMTTPEDELWGSLSKEARKCLPLNNCIISHNGSLSLEQKRRWGSDSFKTAVRWKTVKRPMTANLYTCILESFHITQTTGASIESLTIGHMDHKKGRVSVIQVVKEVYNWLMISGGSKEVILEMMDWLSEKDPNGENTVANMMTPFGPNQVLGGYYQDWLDIKGTKLRVTPELVEARDANTQWGAW